jgi:hypothetical protein
MTHPRRVDLTPFLADQRPMTEKFTSEQLDRVMAGQVALCPIRKSTMTTSNGRTPRFPRNRKPGRCVECGAFLARGEGCLEIHGIKSLVYC